MENFSYGFVFTDVCEFAYFIDVCDAFVLVDKKKKDVFQHVYPQNLFNNRN